MLALLTKSLTTLPQPTYQINRVCMLGYFYTQTGFNQINVSVVIKLAAPPCYCSMLLLGLVAAFTCCQCLLLETVIITAGVACCKRHGYLEGCSMMLLQSVAKAEMFLLNLYTALPHEKAWSLLSSGFVASKVLTAERCQSP